MRSPQAKIQDPAMSSAAYRMPSSQFLEDTREARNVYLYSCVPFYRYALEGNWALAKPMLEDNPTLLNAAISKELATVLHVAAGANQVEFVRQLVRLMDPSDLELQDYKGNTAFCFAAAVGNLHIAQIMLHKNSSLPTIRGGDGLSPIHFAALQGRADMAWFLYLRYHRTNVSFEEAEWNKLFLTCIDIGIYDLALEMLKDRPALALAKDENKQTCLHVLARKPLDFGSHSPGQPSKLTKTGMKHSLPLQLVDHLWKGLFMLVDSELETRRIISTPSQLVIDAAEVGNFDFLAVLMRSYPDLLWEIDTRYRSIIHIAVLHRHESIFNLIRYIGSKKNILLKYKDSDGNNLLHMAAKLAPRNRLELVSGEVFQMKLELLWFEEIRKILPPSYMTMTNKEGITPSELFTWEHAELRKAAESWLLRTADFGMVVSTLIATGAFTAAFSVPGGNNDDTRTPNYMRKPSFHMFAISDAIAMISSSASILIFLSIHLSRYSEYDFLKSLPSKLIFGLVILFVSVTSMMIAFSSAFFISYYHGLKWVPIFISVLSFFPILVLLFLHFRLLLVIIYSHYFLRSLFRPNKHMLY